jgi:L-amino acid N-acyltransferase YncA
MQGAVVVQPMSPDDWEDVRRIFLDGVATGDATFETEAPDWDAWNAGHRQEGRLVARDSGRVVGWAALSPVSARAAYAGVAEVSVYVAPGARRRGVGRSLLMELIRRSETAGVWTLQAGIFPENEASVALHRRCGFRQVGIRERLGQLGGRWRDVMLLERRSDTVRVTKRRIE